MIKDSDTERLFKLYLLGELPRHQHRRVEKRYFEDNDFFDLLLAAEERLIADYKRGALSERDRQLFETYFLSTERRRQRVKDFPATPPPAPPSPDPKTGPLRRLTLWLGAFSDWVRGPKVVMQLALALLLLIPLALLLVRYLKSGPRPAQEIVSLPPRPGLKPASLPPAATPTPDVRLSPQPGRAAATPRDARAQSQPRRQLDVTDRRPPSSGGDVALAVAVVELTPGLVRGVTPVPTANLPSGGSTVLLRIKLPEREYSTYSADLRTEGGRIVRRWPPRRPDTDGKAPTISFRVPGRILPPDFYYLNLYGVSPDGKEAKIDYYPFDVERQ